MLLLSLAARSVLGITFLLAGLVKFATPLSQLLSTIENYGIANKAVARGAAWLLPALECCIGVALIFAFLLPITIMFALMLLLFFSVLHYRALRQGKRFNCSCFGALHSTPLGLGSIMRNTGLIILGICVLLTRVDMALSSLSFMTVTKDASKLAPPTSLIAFLGLFILFSCTLIILDYSSILFASNPTRLMEKLQ